MSVHRRGPDLRPEQVVSAERVATLVERTGVAVLADPVGSGKTFTAIAAALALGGRPSVVAPPPLVGTWRARLASFGLDWTVLSDGLLSVRDCQFGADETGPVIVDEAHRFRNPATWRRRRLLRATGSRGMILVTATPVWRSDRDLVRLLSLRLGDAEFVRVAGLSSRQLVEAPEQDAVAALSESMVVRTEPVRRRSHRVHERWRSPAWTADQRRALALAASAAMVADGEPVSLFRTVVERRLASSPEAFEHTLGRARRFLFRLREAVRCGRTLTRREWRQAFGEPEGPEQAVLPFWYRDEALPGVGLERVERSLADLDRARAAAAGARSAFLDRVARLEAYRREWGVVLVFTEYAASAFAIGRALSTEARAVVVTGGRSHWFGVGRVDRATALELLRGSVAGVDEPPRVAVLTPVVSEGVDLQQRARAVVHWDLPWAPARLEQRVGRVDRVGGPETVGVLTMVPPPGTPGPLVSPSRDDSGAPPRTGSWSECSSRTAPGGGAAALAFVVEAGVVVGVARVGSVGQQWARFRRPGDSVWRACPVSRVADGGGWQPFVIDRGAIAALQEIAASDAFALTGSRSGRREASERLGAARTLEAAGRDSAAVLTLGGTRSEDWSSLPSYVRFT